MAADRKMPKVSYPQVMRDRAMTDGNRLCMIDTPSLSFGGPCTPEEAEEIAKFASAFVVRRMKRVKEQAATVPAEQEVCGQCGGDGGGWSRGVDQDGNQIRLICTACKGSGRFDPLHGEQPREGGEG